MNEHDPHHTLPHLMALEHVIISMAALIAKAVAGDDGSTFQALERMKHDAMLELGIAQRQNGQHPELWNDAHHCLQAYFDRAGWLCDWANEVPGEGDAVN